jgi:large subunit ribosomal protein L15
MPLIRQIPKRGFHNRHGRIVTCVNVDDLEARFAAGSEVNPDTLRASGLAKGVWDSVKILGEGSLSKSLKVSAHHFSAQAREKIVAAGGTVIELPGPAPVVKRQKKVSQKKSAKG